MSLKGSSCVSLKKKTCLSLKRTWCLFLKKDMLFVPHKGQPNCPSKESSWLSLKNDKLYACQEKKTCYLFLKKDNLFVPQEEKPVYFWKRISFSHSIGTEGVCLPIICYRLPFQWWNKQYATKLPVWPLFHNTVHIVMIIKKQQALHYTKTPQVIMFSLHIYITVTSIRLTWRLLETSWWWHLSLRIPSSRIASWCTMVVLISFGGITRLQT